MRQILIINYEYPPLGGGGGIASKKLAEAWCKMGYKVDCITTWVLGLDKFEVMNGVNVYRVPVVGRRTKSTAGMLSLITFPLCAYKLAKQLCINNHYEFVNTHFAVPTGPLGVWVSKKYKIRNILSLHGGDIYDPTKKFSPHRWFFLRKSISWVLNNSDIVVAQSNNTKDNVASYYRYDSSKIKIIPLPYEKINFTPVKRQEIGMEEGDTYLISVGRLVRRKGYDFLLDVIFDLPDIKLVIIGNGPEMENLKVKASRLNIKDRVKFIGNISEERKFQYLYNADIYILSSVHEGFGIVIQEAMQVGLPIVSTNFGGQVDLIKEKENGLLVEYGNKVMMINAIKQLILNEEMRKAMTINNINKIEEYRSENIAERYLKIL